MKTKIRTKAPNVRVLSRYVTLKDKYGRRLQKARWGKWMVWNKHSDMAQNVKDAVQYAVHQLKVWDIGTVVYLKGRAGEPTPIYQAKAGLDGSHFLGWKPNPVAGYWRRKLAK